MKGFNRQGALKALLDELNRIIADDKLLAKLVPGPDLLAIAENERPSPPPTRNA